MTKVLREPEICKDDMPLAVDEDVWGLDIAVNDPAFMQLGESDDLYLALSSITEYGAWINTLFQPCKTELFRVQASPIESIRCQDRWGKASG